MQVILRPLKVTGSYLFKANTPQNEDLHIVSIADVYRSIQAGVNKGTIYNMFGTIIDVDLFNDWKYVKRSKCRKKLRFMDATYYCTTCQQNALNPQLAWLSVWLIMMLR
ncbi:putative nucleic acid-binding protein [Helianthus debilis subsp. tardiflorus]